MASILIVDDDAMVCESLLSVAETMDHQAQKAGSMQAALEVLLQHQIDIVFLDVFLPDGNSLNRLDEIRRVESSPEIIVITGQGDPDSAELAIKSGAWDYIEKPLRLKQVQQTLTRAVQYRQEKMQRTTRGTVSQSGIVGSSSHMRQCLDLLAQAAYSEAGVLITGETGTGKELFARAIHANSRRKDHNFVVVDCAALPESLVESTLFGHRKGAFTGADRSQDGLVRQADAGTLFLDEIGELPLSLQKAFLRVIQEHRFRPVGGRKEVKSDFRLIAATNRNLDRLVEKGLFRHDLLHRLRSIAVDLPPLAQRSEDIPELATYHLKNLCRRYAIAPKTISPDYMSALMKYDWPGNIRELVNALERSISAARNHTTLFTKHLPLHIRIKLTRASLDNGNPPECTEDSFSQSATEFPTLKQLLQVTEIRYLKDLICQTSGDVAELCRISGLSRSRLYERLKRYQISRHSWQ